MVSPPSYYPNPRSDDPWDNDAVHWLLTHPDVAARFNRGPLMECARRQSGRVARGPIRVEEAARFCRQYGVQQLDVIDPRVGKRITRLRRTDRDAPEYPDYDAMLLGLYDTSAGASATDAAATSGWDLMPGQTAKRTDLHSAYGGSGQGGISPSSRSPNVLIFSDPATGEQHGYFDGWHDDGLFHYTGEGQRGDQQIRAGNAAILTHRERGRALRVFDGARGIVTYVGEFEVASHDPYYLTDAPETNDGPVREVIVFRLRPLDGDSDGTSPIDPLLKRRVEHVAVEQQMTERAWVEPRSEGHEAIRREQTLVLDFQRYLEARGVRATRLKIVPDGEHKPLFTDLYAVDLNLLVEAKGTCERGSLRMAIGQLADYRRFVEPPPTCAVLLPRPPREDLRALLDAEGIASIWQVGTLFKASPVDTIP